MKTLVVIDPQGQKRNVTLAQECLTIGRRSDNDLVLDDAAVSGRHAALVRMDDDVIIEDLGSTNGTTVNGRTVSKQLLSVGDEIGVGRHTLRLQLDYGSSDSAPDATVKLSSSSRAAPVEGDAAMPLGMLRIESGPQAGREIALEKPLVQIGKPGVQLAAITRRNDGYFIVNAGRERSTRPAMLNDKPVGNLAIRLHNGDILEIGGARMTFHMA